jgi:hypothetical protein
MVIAVRCPEGDCRKYQLVEHTDRGKVVACLVCKASIRVPAAEANPPPVQKATPLPPNLPRATPL